MILLSGPPGSGKTRLVLEQVRDALRRDATDFRLLVPTAAMARHLRARLASEGFVVRSALIQSLRQFVAPYVQDYPEPSPGALEFLVRTSLVTNPPAPFASIARRPGLWAALARLIEEFSAAGCDARRLSRALEAVTPEAPLAPAFLAVYEAVEKQLLRRGWAMASSRLRSADEEIRARGIPNFRHVFLDGFQAFSDPELNLIESIRTHTNVTVTLPQWHGAAIARDTLLALGFVEQSLTPRRRRAEAVVVRAVSVPREVEEIARRILAHVSGGTALRDIAVVVRDRDLYVPALKATLARFGIPASFSFAEPLAEHPVVRLFTAAVNAMRSGWDHGLALEALNGRACGFGGTDAGDRFDFAVRQRLAGQGLEDLRRLSDDLRLRALLDRLAALESWQARRALPTEWAAHARTLLRLYQPPRITDGVTHETAALWRSHPAALAGFEEAVDEAAVVLPAQEPAPLSTFWEAVELILKRKPLRTQDHRHDVVHVADAGDALHREAPVVFVCGLSDQGFPRHPAPDSILPDGGRAALRRAGLRIDTGAELLRREELLFDVAVSRATRQVVLSYAETNTRGEPALPSLFLRKLSGAHEETARPIALRATVRPATPRHAHLQDVSLIGIVQQRHAVLTAAAVEDFLGCPFAFFLRHTLSLEAPPAPPARRLHATVEDRIVHQVLSEVERGQGALEAVFDRVFDERCRAERVPPGCRTELVRLNLLRDLRRFLARSQRLPGWTTNLGQPVRFLLSEGIELADYVDRCDVSPDGRAVVFDFKHRGEFPRRPTIRGALYLYGLADTHGYTPAGFLHWGERGKAALDGWHVPLTGLETTGAVAPSEELRARLAGARDAAAAAAKEIRRGRVERLASDSCLCRSCTYLEACRVSARPPGCAEAAP